MALAPVAATVLAALFAVRTAVVARRTRSRALAVWSFALAQFAVAAAALTWGVAVGWAPGLYRAFYLFGAITNVAWLGLGTVWLLAPRSAAVAATVLLVGASAYAAAAVISTELLPGAARVLATHAIPAPGDVIGADVRMLSRWFSIGGSVVVLGGVLLSAARRRRQALGLGLLAAGIVVTGVAGQLARIGLATGFSIALACGIALMYLGFSRTSPQGPQG